MAIIERPAQLVAGETQIQFIFPPAANTDSLLSVESEIAPELAAIT